MLMGFRGFTGVPLVLDWFLMALKIFKRIPGGCAVLEEVSWCWES